MIDKICNGQYSDHFLYTHKLGLLDEICPSSVKFTKLICRRGAGGAVRHLNQKVSCFIQLGLERAPF